MRLRARVERAQEQHDEHGRIVERVQEQAVEAAHDVGRVGRIGGERADRVLRERRVPRGFDAFSARVGDQEPAEVGARAPGVQHVAADQRFARRRRVREAHLRARWALAADAERALERVDEDLALREPRDRGRAADRVPQRDDREERDDPRADRHRRVDPLAQGCARHGRSRRPARRAGAAASTAHLVGEELARRLAACRRRASPGCEAAARRPRASQSVWRVRMSSTVAIPPGIDASRSAGFERVGLLVERRLRRAGRSRNARVVGGDVAAQRGVFGELDPQQRVEVRAGVRQPDLRAGSGVELADADQRPGQRGREEGRDQQNDWRRRPESNWGWSFCRALPYHLATSPGAS